MHYDHVAQQAETVSVEVAQQPADKIDHHEFVNHFRAPEVVDSLKPQTTAQPLPKIVHESSDSDIVDLVYQSVYSFSFIGGQRCGKSRLMAIASQHCFQRKKFKTVSLISAMSSPGEDEHYWSHCQEKCHIDLSTLITPGEREKVYHQFYKIIESFTKTANKNNPQLLIIDEYAFLGENLAKDAKLKDGKNLLIPIASELQNIICSLISAVSSGGAKKGWHIWCGSPKGAIGAMGQFGQALKSLRLLFCAIKPGVSVESNGVTATWDEGLFKATSLNFPALRKPEGMEKLELGDRIVFLGDRWYDQTSLDFLGNLKPTIQASQPLQPASATSTETESEQILQLLASSPVNNLWSFAANILGIIDPEEIKEIALAIAELLCEAGNEQLAHKYRIRTPHDVRYSYPGYSTKVAETHRLTGNICACCGQVESVQAHHTEYRGAEDTPGENLFPVCLDCHKSFCHSKENWQKADNIWDYRNTPEFVSQLRANTVILASS